MKQTHQHPLTDNSLEIADNLRSLVRVCYRDSHMEEIESLVGSEGSSN